MMLMNSDVAPDVHDRTLDIDAFEFFFFFFNFQLFKLECNPLFVVNFQLTNCLVIVLLCMEKHQTITALFQPGSTGDQFCFAASCSKICIKYQINEKTHCCFGSIELTR